LSEQEKIANLQKKIKTSKKNKVIGATTTVLAGVTILAGIILSIWNIGFIAILFVYGIYLYVHSSGQYNNLMKEAEKTAQTIPNPPCLNCGKELLKGNFDFCPFCGNSIKP
jgi:hypothetical protein